MNTEIKLENGERPSFQKITIALPFPLAPPLLPLDLLPPPLSGASDAWLLVPGSLEPN